MAEIKHIIEPERYGTWIAATFIIALLALAVALGAVYQVNDLTTITQGQVVLLNKKIDANAAAPAAAETPAPEALAE